MKHFFRWIWHGENVAPRIGRAFASLVPIFGVNGFTLPDTPSGWLALGISSLGAIGVSTISKPNGGAS